MDRLSAFRDLTASGQYGLIWDRLPLAEREQVYSFISIHSTASVADFEMRVNRMFMDQKKKPKNWVLITDLLLAVNSRYVGALR
jgi:hypothetical protein